MEQKNEKSGVSRNKVLQVIASILVAVAIWVYVDVEKAPERTKTIRDIPVEFSGESTTLAEQGQCAPGGQHVQHRLRGCTHPAMGRGIPRWGTVLGPVGGLGQQVQGDGHGG